MKTRTMIVALVLVLSSFGLSASPKRFLTIHDSFGRTLTMPIQEEEATDSLPFNLKEEFKRAVQLKSNQILDLSGMVAPEKDAQDAPFDLQAIFREVSAK